MDKKSSDPFEALLKPSEEKNMFSAPVGLTDVSGRYRLGVPKRPNIKHDNGHLDTFPHEPPTAADRAKLLKWEAMLMGSEALCDARFGKYVGKCNGEDLTDANGAYRHFLHGNGVDRKIDYERYLKNDPSGRQLLPLLMDDFKKHATVIGRDRIKFSITSDSFSVGHKGIAPYPETANWQKALGAHFIWVSADIAVSANSKGMIVFDATVTVHVEDRYNFNPGSSDVATGIPDSANGRFEITGLAKQYTSYASISRNVKWEEGTPSSKRN